MTGKFKVGDKVIPISKTIMGDLDDSVVWRKAQAQGQGFIYVAKVAVEASRYVCSEKEDETGDYFSESDLIPYVEVKRTGTIVELYNLMELDDIALVEDNSSLSVYKDKQGNLKWVDDDKVVKFCASIMNTEFQLVKPVRNYIPLTSVYFTIADIFYEQDGNVSKLSFDKAFTLEELTTTRFFHYDF